LNSKSKLRRSCSNYDLPVRRRGPRELPEREDGGFQIANVYAGSRAGKVLNKTKCGAPGLYVVENLLSGEHK
jgi:hypothetical protein